MITDRRNVVVGSMVGGIAALFSRVERSAAQFTEQEVRNAADIVATGDVNLSQSASGRQSVLVDVNGTPITEDGIYRTEAGQVVVNNGRVVATGDVNVSQSSSGNQSAGVHAEAWPHRDGDRAEVCQPGAVMANPNTGQVFYQAFDCCWYAACSAPCQAKGCEGDICG